MAASLQQIMNGLKTRIESIPILGMDTTMVDRVFTFLQGTFEPPSCTIVPGTFIPGDTKAAITYDRTMSRGSHDYVFTLVMAVSRTLDRESSEQLFAFLATDTPQSVKLAIEADETLGGVVSFSHVDRVIQYGPVNWNGNDFFGAQIIVEVTA